MKPMLSFIFMAAMYSANLLAESSIKVPVAETFAPQDCGPLYKKRRQRAALISAGLIIGGGAVAGASGALFVPAAGLGFGAGIMVGYAGMAGAAGLAGGIANAISSGYKRIDQYTHEAHNFLVSGNVERHLKRFVDKKVNFDASAPAGYRAVSEVLVKGMKGDFCPKGKYKMMKKSGVLKYVRSLVHNETHTITDKDYYIKETPAEKIARKQKENEDKEKQKRERRREELGL